MGSRRGKSADAPLLIHVQAGPGLPMIPEAYTMEKQLHLENNFLVAYRDQRATKFSTPDVARCCFSLKSIKPNSIPLSS
jgi:hypothetical protein